MKHRVKENIWESEGEMDVGNEVDVSDSWF